MVDGPAAQASAADSVGGDAGSGHERERRAQDVADHNAAADGHTAGMPAAGPAATLRAQRSRSEGSHSVSAGM
jgi:hypothetical protein